MKTSTNGVHFDPRRSDAIEKLLSDTVTATTNTGDHNRPRLSGRLVIGSIAAFALAGALTGGAIASAASVNTDQAAAETSAQYLGQEWAAQQDAQLLGTPIVRSTSTTLVIPLGSAPDGANTIVEGFVCIDPGTFNEGVDSHLSSSEECGTSQQSSGSSSGYPTTGRGTHTFTVRSQGSARYAVWVSWAKTPNLAPSAEERAELSDGIVTHEEDLAAYGRYAVCMAALGHPIESNGYVQSGIVPDSSVNDAAVSSGADNRCYLTQYQDVDRLWQTEVEQGTQAAKSIQTCITKYGAEPAESAAQWTQQLTKLGKDWHLCPYVG
jgi:hypothetical protein